MLRKKGKLCFSYNDYVLIFLVDYEILKYMMIHV
jgi:hypothetical protein